VVKTKQKIIIIKVSENIHYKMLQYQSINFLLVNHTQLTTHNNHRSVHKS
jgi:hypothetical protein